VISVSISIQRLEDYSLDSKCLASYVVFRELYDGNKSDVYHIVSEFAKDIIISRNLFHFGSSEITSMINSEFGFKLPENVVKTSLGRLSCLVNNGKGVFTVDKKLLKVNEDQVAHIRRNAVSSADNVIDRLVEHVEKQEGILTPHEKKQLSSAFCMFLLDGEMGAPYSKNISSFIILHQDNEQIINSIESIREGAILFAGLNYNVDINVQKHWRNELNLFLDQEILFYLAGYNGSIYQEMVEELLKLAAEMNRRSRGNLKFYYFQDVRERIDGFFLSAEDIAAGRKRLALDSGEAMLEILRGSSSASDIIEKKSKFYGILRSLNIKEYEPTIELYNPEKYKNNLESAEIVSKFGIDDTNYKSIKYLNYINALRDGSESFDLENARHILISETTLTRSIAYHIAAGNNDNRVPLAISLQNLTSRLWFDLNKGFGADGFPKSLGIMAKARIVLSGLIGQSITSRFNDAKTKYEDNSIDEETMKSVIVELRSCQVKPEDITNENVDDLISMMRLTESDVDLYRDNNRRLQAELEDARIENQQLTTSLENMTQTLNEFTEKMYSIEKEQNDQRERNRQKANAFVDRKMLLLKVLYALLICIALVLSFVLGSSNKIIWAGGALAVMAILPLACATLYSLTTEKKFDLLLLLRRYRNHLRQISYKKHGLEFDPEIDGV